VNAAALKLTELIDQNQEFDLMNEHNQMLVGKLMNEFTNNLSIQVTVLKLLEYSLKPIVDENLANSKNENLKKTLTFIHQLLEKFFYIFLVAYFRLVVLEIQFYLFSFILFTRNMIIQANYNSNPSE
jgi:hypothetical protein